MPGKAHGALAERGDGLVGRAVLAALKIAVEVQGLVRELLISCWRRVPSRWHGSLWPEAK